MGEYPDHIQYIVDKQGLELEKTLSRENLSREKAHSRVDPTITLDQAMEVFLLCDPTRGKRLVDWLVKTYVQGGFRWEDIVAGAQSKLAEVLRDYTTHFSKIPRNQRNIYQYKSYGSLYKLVQPYLTKPEDDNFLSGKEIKRKDRNQAYKESILIHDTEEMIVAVPLTEFASSWWGRGTKWCTAARSENQFYEYNKDGPLIAILIDQKDLNRSENLQGSTPRKFQLWVTEAEIQFMDEADDDLTQDIVRDYWTIIQPIVEWAVQQNGSAIQYVPIEFRTADLCRIAVEQTGKALFYVPDEYKTPELCKLAVEQNGFSIFHVPDAYITYELCMLAIKQNAESFLYIPTEYTTDSFCKLMVQQNPGVILYMSPSNTTPELCRIAVEQDGNALGCLPYELITYDLCKRAVEQTGSAICHVPNHLIDSDIRKISQQKQSKQIDKTLSNGSTKTNNILSLPKKVEEISSVKWNSMMFESLEIKLDSLLKFERNLYQ